MGKTAGLRFESEVCGVMVTIPRKASAKTHPELCRPVIMISIDGQCSREVLAYDMDEGWADVVARDEDGHIIAKYGQLQSNRRYGVIRVWPK